MPIGPEGVEPPSGSYKEPALTVELRAVRLAEPSIPVGPEGIEPSPARLKVCCAAVTPRPQKLIRGVRFNRRAFIAHLPSGFPVARGGVEPPLPPYQSGMLPLQHQAANRGGGNRIRCYVRPRPPLFAAVPGGPPLPFTPHSQTLYSNSSSGNRTPSSALKGQYPGPVDERAVRARCAQVGRVVPIKFDYRLRESHARGSRSVASPGFQPGATPSQLPTH